jgi:hypothetical protein
MNSFVIFALILVSPSVFGEEHAARFGHNLTATSYTLKRHECTVGVQVTGCGISDRLTVGMSTWMTFDYKIGNIGARYRLSEDPKGNAWAIQASYFKTYLKVPDREFLKRPYEMEAWWFMIIRTLNLAPHYKLHLNLHTNYYIDDEMPFSLRRPIPDRNNGQINLSSLHELELINRWFILTELGLMDIGQVQKYAHAGASIGRSGQSYHWHVGYSMSATLKSLSSPTKRNDYQQELRETTAGYHQQMSRDKSRRDYGLHPEFSLQIFF